jgi:hypothetical protein
MAVKRYFPVRTMPEPCPACSCKTGKETMVTGVFNCTSCGGVVGKCYRGEALAMVEFDKEMVADRPCPMCEGKKVIGGGSLPEVCCSACRGTGRKKVDFATDVRYFDFTFIDTQDRIHGWFDRNTLRVVQIG